MHTSFNKYHLSTQLGRKSLRDVYIAYPVDEPEHEVVLKVFDATCLPSNYNYGDFVEKANLIKQLNHQYIVPVLDIGIEEGEPYVVSEYLPYGSLRSRMDSASSERLATADALNICIQLGQALSYIHQFNVVHGNVKPENILFDADGNVLLADFSLVGLIDINKLGYKSEAHGVSYMAPEQFISNVSEKSDQYALACIVYEIITGRVPFTAHGFSLMWLKHSTDAPVAPSKIVPDLPQSIEVALLKALANDPAERHGDIATFIEPFQSLLLSQPAQTSAFPAASTHTGGLSGFTSNETSAVSHSRMPLFKSPAGELSVTASITDEEPEDAMDALIEGDEDEDEDQYVVKLIEEEEEENEYIASSVREEESEYAIESMKEEEEDEYVLGLIGEEEHKDEAEDLYMARPMRDEEAEDPYMAKPMRDKQPKDPYIAGSIEDEEEEEYVMREMEEGYEEDEDEEVIREVKENEEEENEYVEREMEEEEEREDDEYIDDVIDDDEDNEEDNEHEEYMMKKNDKYTGDEYEEMIEEENKYIDAYEDDTSVEVDDFASPSESPFPFRPGSRSTRRIAPSFNEAEDPYVGGSIEDEDTEDQYADAYENNASVEDDNFPTSSGAAFPFGPGSRSLQRVAFVEEGENEYIGEGEEDEDQYMDEAMEDEEAEDQYADVYEDDNSIDADDDPDSPSGTPFPFGSGGFSRRRAGAFNARSRQRLKQQSSQLDDDDDDDNVKTSVGVIDPLPQKQTVLHGEKLMVPDLDEPPRVPPPTPTPLPRPARSKKGPILLLIVVLIFSLGIVYTHFSTGGSPTTQVTPTPKPTQQPTQAVVVAPTTSESTTPPPVLPPTSTSPTAVATSTSPPPPPETPSATATVAASPTSVPTPVPPPPPPPPTPKPIPLPTPTPTPTPTPVPQTNLTCPYEEYNQYTNLTSEGTLDWEQWGLNEATDVNRKAGVTPQISSFMLLGNGRIASDHTNPINFTWSNGTRTKSVKRSTGAIYVTGLNNGFSITVPASSTPRTLRLYVGANLARGLFFASLSGITCRDASLDMTHDPTKTVDNAVYTITYSTNLPNQKITINYTEMQSNGNTGYILLEAATLQ